MTTPAHCTRTDDHERHCDMDLEGCDACRPGVEPPADVQATPDPRLDVVAQVLFENLHVTVGSGDFVAQRILDALDAMRPDEPAIMHNPDAMCLEQFPDRPWLTCRARLGHDGPHMWIREPTDTPAPAGLTPAQQIRLEIFRHWDDPGETRDEWAAWIEHGPDETPALRVRRDDGFELACLRDENNRLLGAVKVSEGSRDRALAEADTAEARADLAEARLGHIADALRDLTDPLCDEAFETAVRDALAWTPDDTAPAASVCPSTGEVSGHDKAGCSCWDDTAPADEICDRCGQPAYGPTVQGLPAAHGMGFCVPTAPAGAATGDGE